MARRPGFLCINIDTPNRTEDLGKRQAIAKAVLRSIQALPPDPGNGAAR
jgi:beta-lactamase class D